MPDLDGFLPLSRVQDGFLPLKQPDVNVNLAGIRGAGSRPAGTGEEADEVARLRQAAKDFEAVFLFQVLKQMRKTVQKEELFHGGMGEDFFSEMMDEELARRMAGRSPTGIGELLFQQLSRRYGIGTERAGDEGQFRIDASQSAGALQQRLQQVRAEVKAPSRVVRPAPR